MIYSMTGFGEAHVDLPTGKLSVEIRSLNSKGLDINFRLPSKHKPLDMRIRKLLSDQLIRGKIEGSIFFENPKSKLSKLINKVVVKNYIDELKSIVNVDESYLLKIAMTLPDSIKLETTEEQSIQEDEVIRIIEKAIAEMKKFRAQEGSVLQKDILNRIGRLKIYLKDINTMSERRTNNIRFRLKSLVSELKEKIDENRFEQEMIYYLEKLDITEEQIRLEAHLDYFITTAGIDGIHGKKLGFISQEIGREINTIGSKSNDALMQQKVVDMKDELEKIKEQLFNVL